ncbi:MAG: CPBP family intramembrane metalloprotease [Bacteroidetes bacterium]|nr:CPBP family intramembrane metalloprotease [Bacteroidota bacterium]
MLKNLKLSLLKTVQDTELLSVEYRSSRSTVFDYKAVFLAIIIALSLVMIEYIGKSPGYLNFISFLQTLGLGEFGKTLKNALEVSPKSQINQLIYWVSIVFSFYFVLPIIVIKFIFKEKLGDYGLKIGNAFKDYRIYLFMLVVMIPLVLYFSTTASFQERYPFYHLKLNEKLYPYFFVWQILYFFQFIGVEFFFRGFIVHGFKKQFGVYSILIMMIPYCMIHFGKPMPETIAAIFAGLVLGMLSLKSNSIWLGVAIHYSVAITMDLAALWQKGYFN